MAGLDAGGTLDQRARPIVLAMAVDLVTQPGQELCKLASGEGVVQPAQVGACLGEELCRVEVAQRVGWEISKEPGAPVDVLQAPLSVVRRGDAHCLLILLVPRRGQVARR